MRFVPVLAVFASACSAPHEATRDNGGQGGSGLISGLTFEQVAEWSDDSYGNRNFAPVPSDPPVMIGHSYATGYTDSTDHYWFVPYGSESIASFWGVGGIDGAAIGGAALITVANPDSSFLVPLSPWGGLDEFEVPENAILLNGSSASIGSGRQSGALLVHRWIIGATWTSASDFYRVRSVDGQLALTQVGTLDGGNPIVLADAEGPLGHCFAWAKFGPSGATLERRCDSLDGETPDLSRAAARDRVLVSDWVKSCDPRVWAYETMAIANSGDVLLHVDDGTDAGADLLWQWPLTISGPARLSRLASHGCYRGIARVGQTLLMATDEADSAFQYLYGIRVDGDNPVEWSRVELGEGQALQCDGAVRVEQGENDVAWVTCFSRTNERKGGREVAVLYRVTSSAAREAWPSGRSPK